MFYSLLKKKRHVLAGVVWGLLNGYKLLGYGLLVYLVINTLAIVLKLANGKKDNDEDQ